MIKFTLCIFAFSVSCLFSFANIIKVKNANELHTANKIAKPGDIIILQNGEWNNVNIELDCMGSKTLPIIFKAETAGKVFIVGKSTLSIGGSYIIIDGLYFANGYAGSNAVITFRTNADKVANNCILVNTVIDDFNNPKRLEENYWIELYGKHNNISHCSFLNKKNIGVLMAVILNDEKSQENFHSIDHNYFGVRIPLASNGGEIIRVGVSQQCEFNSNTQITNNFFENCDGETEIISLKSGSNVVRNNLFKECQGAVVLRHGNFNTVENNIFLGNDKEGTGGVRIINKGQWVVNNLFYKCRGEGFRSPLAVMNGIPNSPAFRYVAVSDAVIYGNTFFECAPISFCEGSDTERTLQPKTTFFVNNIIYNTRDTSIYKVSDDVAGISFDGNFINKEITQQIFAGFTKTAIPIKQTTSITLPFLTKTNNRTLIDSLQTQARQRLLVLPTQESGFKTETLLKSIQQNATTNCGAKWFAKTSSTITKEIFVTCKSANELKSYLRDSNQYKMNIVLTENEYVFTEPLQILNNAIISTKNKQPIKFFFPSATKPFLFLLNAGSQLTFINLNLDLSEIKSKAFISTDTSAPSNHTNFKMDNCTIENNDSTFFYASKSAVCDSIIITKTNFKNNKSSIFNLAQETDKKGYYPVEKMTITNCIFENNNGELLNVIRTGNDESTMGPTITFTHNKIISCNNTFNTDALISFYGVQKSTIEKNIFDKSNPAKKLIEYKDEVRASHFLKDNQFISSGTIEKNKYVLEKN